MEENPHASAQEIIKRSRRLAKNVIHFHYGVAMSNKPQFTSNRQERVLKINETFPGYMEKLENLVRLSRHGVEEINSFTTLIAAFRPRVKKNLERMIEVRNQTLAQKNIQKE